MEMTCLAKPYGNERTAFYAQKHRAAPDYRVHVFHMHLTKTKVLFLSLRNIIFISLAPFGAGKR